MEKTDKLRLLKRHKALATILLLLMVGGYVLTVALGRHQAAAWIGYVRSFAEAAMVGALADWFAVTALFHHPLGLPIPHTNLIERSKKSIGDNLGYFVVSNFLTAANIRPYLQQLRVSAYAAQWLRKGKNRQWLLSGLARMLGGIVRRLDDRSVARFMARKGSELLRELPLHRIVANALSYFLDRNEHEKLVTLLANRIAVYVEEHEELVRQRVKSESYFFIPGFVNNKLAEKISGGLVRYFREIGEDRQHPVRAEVTAQLYRFAEELQTQPRWEDEFHRMKDNLLSADKLDQYAQDLWTSLKASLQQELDREDSPLMRYFAGVLDDFAASLDNDPAMQQQIDGWVRLNAYRYILRNTQQVGALISNTVGNWQGRELSQKLETEVGKDLQFIRINGTLVGGLVGLLIHALTVLLS